jgi:hydrogenase maturation factor
MHDPTEGGIANATNELAICSDVGAILVEERIPIFPITLKLCEDFGLEPLGVISSGALLIVADPSFSAKIISAIQGQGISCTRIGKILAREAGVSIEDKGERRPLPMFDSDEIAKIF